MGAVYQLQAHDFMQLPPDSIGAWLTRWQQTWAAVETTHTRLVFRAVPVNLQEPLHRARRSETAARDDATVQHIRQYAGQLHDLSASSTLLGVEHYLVFPEVKGHDDGNLLADAFASGMGLRAREVPDLPPCLPPVLYTEDLTYLKPAQAGNYPLVSVLVSYDLAGQWDWRVVPAFLQVGFPLTLSLHVVTYHGAAAYAKLDFLQDVLGNLARQTNAHSSRLQKQMNDMRNLLNFIQAGDSLHQLGLAVLVNAPTLADLRERERQVLSAATGRAYLRRLDGKQGDLFRSYFTAAAKPLPPTGLLHNTTSAGMALASGPLGLRRRSETAGVAWGISSQMPFFWDGFGEQLKEPNHGVIFGATGSGKTFFTSCIGLREANLMGAQWILLDPIGNCQNAVAALGPERASYNPLALSSLRINPIECIHADMTEQADHLNVMVTLLMGRNLSEDEGIALDATLPLIYSGITPQTPAVNQPRIETLCLALRSLTGERWLTEAGQQLGSRLEEKYVRGTYARNFNVPTQADWRLTSDLVAFNFRGLPQSPELTRLLYYLVLSTIQREAYAQARSRRRIVMIDEFRVMSAEPVLARRVAEMYKTFRTLGVGVWAMEQDTITFTGAERAGANSGVDTQAGEYILSNSTFVVAFAMRQIGARNLPRYWPHLNQGHVEYLMALQPQRNDSDKGRGLVILPGEVYPFKFTPTPSELATFGSS